MHHCSRAADRDGAGPGELVLTTALGADNHATSSMRRWGLRGVSPQASGHTMSVWWASDAVLTTDVQGLVGRPSPFFTILLLPTSPMQPWQSQTSHFKAPWAGGGKRKGQLGPPVSSLCRPLLLGRTAAHVGKNLSPAAPGAFTRGNSVVQDRGSVSRIPAWLPQIPRPCPWRLQTRNKFDPPTGQDWRWEGRVCRDLPENRESIGRSWSHSLVILGALETTDIGKAWCCSSLHQREHK